MCHCFSDLPEMSDEERAEILKGHTTEEVRSEYPVEELQTVVIAG